MELEIIMLSEVTQVQRGKGQSSHVFSHIQNLDLKCVCVCVCVCVQGEQGETRWGEEYCNALCLLMKPTENCSKMGEIR
jgi:hypothetical protein